MADIWLAEVEVLRDKVVVLRGKVGDLESAMERRREIVVRQAAKIRELRAQVEGFMVAEHREKCGGSSNLDDFGFGKCQHIQCVAYRRYLKEQGTVLP